MGCFARMIDSYLNMESKTVEEDAVQPESPAEQIAKRANRFFGAMLTLSALTVVFSPVAMGFAIAVHTSAIRKIEALPDDSKKSEKLKSLKRDRIFASISLVPGVATAGGALVIGVGVAVGAVALAVVAVLVALMVALAIFFCGVAVALSPFYGIYRLIKCSDCCNFSSETA